MIEFEFTPMGMSLVDDDESSSIFLSMSQWRTLVAYAETHPLDKHGWFNRIREDGILMGRHACPCHDVS